MAKLDKLKAMMMGTAPSMKGKGSSNMPMKKSTSKGKKGGKPC